MQGYGGYSTGTYTVSYNCSNSGGDSDSSTDTSNITIIALTADTAYADSTTYSGEYVYFEITGASSCAYINIDACSSSYDTTLTLYDSSIYRCLY